jgi:hypothetical protein
VLQVGQQGLTPAAHAETALIARSLQAQTAARHAAEDAAAGSSSSSAARSPLLLALVQASVAVEQRAQRKLAAVGSPSRSPYRLASGTAPGRHTNSSCSSATAFGLTPGETVQLGHSALQLKWPRQSELPVGLVVLGAEHRVLCAFCSTKTATMAQTGAATPSIVCAQPAVGLLAGAIAAAEPLRWEWRLQQVGLQDEHFAVGVAVVSRPSASTAQNALLWSAAGKLSTVGDGALPAAAVVEFSPQLRSSDVLAAELDAAGKTLTLYRNRARVGLALGSVGSGAAVELSFTAEQWSQLRPCVQLLSGAASTDECSSVELSGAQWLVEQQDATAVTAGAVSGVTASAPWFENVCSSLEMLAALARREVSYVVMIAQCVQVTASLYRQQQHHDARSHWLMLISGDAVCSCASFHKHYVLISDGCQTYALLAVLTLLLLILAGANSTGLKSCSKRCKASTSYHW